MATDSMFVSTMNGLHEFALVVYHPSHSVRGNNLSCSTGEIVPGKRADIVVADIRRMRRRTRLRKETTIVNGQILFNRLARSIPRAVVIALLTVSALHGQVAQRPFMLVSASDYDSLGARASRWPWSVMKSRAIERASALSYQEHASLNRKTALAHDLGSACALAFVLDPERRRTYIEKVEHDLRRFIHDIRITKETAADPTAHEMNVGPAHAAFMTYLVLDIMHDHLDPAVRRFLEEDCDFIATHHHNAWLESKYAIEGMQELYHRGVTDEFRRRKDTYKNYLLSMTSVDGIYGTGPGYAYSRLYMKDRVQKKMFMDVCEYQGIHEFYSNPVFQHLYEWLFGYAFTPFNRTYTFGDTPPTKTLNEFSPALFRVGRFSPLAAAYAAWFLGSPSDEVLEGGLLPYLMYSAPWPEARSPVSRVFRNGGAWLLQRDYGPRALAGVLWNVAPAGESHSHYDVNAVSIVGFGEHLLRNSGYDNWKEPDSVLWEWIHRDARSSNTLTLDGMNHVQTKGGGISESIVGLDVEYACGKSGAALNNGAHSRSLVFVQPSAGLPGWFIVMDEVKSRHGQAAVNLYYHPSASRDPEIITKDRDYLFEVKNCFTSNAIRQELFFLHTPENVAVREGYFGSNEECNRFVGKYLEVTYSTAPDGSGRYATVVIPSLSESTPPRITQAATAACEAVIIDLAPDVRDVLVAPDAGGSAVYEHVEIQAALAYWRESKHTTCTYFVKSGTKLLHPPGGSCGFTSSAEVSLVMTGNTGEIVSPGAFVTLYRPGVRDVLLDGAGGRVVKRGDGFVCLEVPAGNHRVELVETGR